MTLSTGWRSTPSKRQVAAGCIAPCPARVARRTSLVACLPACDAPCRLPESSSRGACSLRASRASCSVYLTPHIAGVTELSYRNMADVVAEATRRVCRGLPPERLLNAPLAARGLAAVGEAPQQ